jgi:hypothetical protein
MGCGQVFPAFGGGQSAGLCGQGEGCLGMAAQGAVQAAGGDDGGRRLGEGEAREGAGGHRVHGFPPTT